ncbi:MAG: hypothetical protein JOZ69_25635, partial [Myxococcales bacterium]|nr:hypothetical protein [Myxococcales bacterium]
AFGKPEQNVWELIDDGPPPIMAVPAEGGAPVLMEGDLLAIPSGEDPEVTIFRAAENHWVIESAADPMTSIRNLQTFTAGGRTWRFCCPEEVHETAMATGARDLEVRHLRLMFFVSRDEEHVSLRLTCGGRAIDMGSRQHNYFLLTLARRRLEDASNGIAESSCGWTYQDDLAQGLQMSGSLPLNLDVYRIRRQFGSAGVSDAAGIIERRPRTRQLRIGTSNLEVVRV